MQYIKEKLLGVWHLRSVTFTGEKGEEVDYFGKNPCGSIIYNEDGTMAAQFMNTNRASFSTTEWFTAPPEEVKEAFVKYQSYFGNYELVADNEVHHHVKGSLFPNWHNEQVTEVRYFELKGNYLTIKSAPIHVAGRDTVFTLVWERPSGYDYEYIYSVVVKVDKEVAEEWVYWMKETHIQEVMDKGAFQDYTFTQLLQNKQGQESREHIYVYETQYVLHNLDLFLKYSLEDAPKLRESVPQKYLEKMKVTRELYRKKVLDF
jgi:hypothetical protein